MGNDSHRFLIRNSVQFGFECCNLPAWPAPSRFYPFNLDRFQISAQRQKDIFSDTQPQAMPQISQASNGRRAIRDSPAIIPVVHAFPAAPS